MECGRWVLPGDHPWKRTRSTSLSKALRRAAKSHQYAVSFSISVLAVLVALATVLSHRAHTEACVAAGARHRRVESVPGQEDSAEQHLHDERPADACSLPATPQPPRHWTITRNTRPSGTDDLKESDEKARELESDVINAEHKASRFRFGRGPAADCGGAGVGHAADAAAGVLAVRFAVGRGWLWCLRRLGLLVKLTPSSHRKAGDPTSRF